MIETNQLIAAIVSIFMPPLISFLKNVNWPTWKKQLLPLLVAVVVSLLVATLNIADYWKNFGNNLWLTATIIYATYTAIWEKIPVENWLRSHNINKKE